MAFLELKNVGKIYASEGTIAVGIRSVDLSFERGELVAITGASGSGKTTLLSVISGMDTYEEGELLIEGEPTSHYTERDREYYREKYISFVFQDYNIIESFTVLQNVELALMHVVDRRERRRRALDLIERVGLLAEAKQKGSTLSGGQKQRTVIARALAKDSPILLADEPTGNLDAKSAAEIVHLLTELAEDKLVIIVTHSLGELDGCATRHIRIFDGGVESDRPLAPTREVKSEAAVSSPKKPSLGSTLHHGFLLGRTLLLARPRLSAFLSLLLLIGMLAVFLLTSLCRDAGAVFSPPTMFTHIKGRVVVTTQSGSPIPESELSALATSLGARSYLSLDLLLDETGSVATVIPDASLGGRDISLDGILYGFSLWDDPVRRIYDLRYAYGEAMPKPDVGRRPQSEREAMLSVPIGYRDLFGKSKLLVSRVTLGDLEYDLVGVNYYYDNNLSPSVHLTEEGFAYASAAHYLLWELSTRVRIDGESTLPDGGYIHDDIDELIPVFDLGTPLYSNRGLEGYTAEITLTVNEYSDGSGESFLAERHYTVLDLTEERADTRFLTGRGRCRIDAALLLELSREAVPSAYAQASFFFSSDAEAERAARELRELGYVAVPSDTTYTPDPFETVIGLIGAVMQALLWLAGTLFVAFFLSVAVSRAMRAFGSDIAILRSMGIRSSVVCIGIYVRMLLSMLPGAVSVAAVALIVFRSPTLNGYFVYLYPRHYATIAFGALLLTLAVTHRATKRLFRNSVRHTLRGGEAK